MFPDQYKKERAMDVSSDEEPYDSDMIDSDVEAELYSVIHHETDNSTINFEDSCYSLNTSNKENASIILDYKEFNVSNVSFEKSNQIVLNNNNNNSTNVEIIEIVDKFSDDKIMERSNKDKIENVIEDSLLKRKSNSNSFVFDDTQTCKKQKNNEHNVSKITSGIVNSKTNDSIVLDSSDEDDIICIAPLDNQKHFETNVSQIIVTDSDSDSTDSWCFKSPKVNTSTPSNDKSKGQWFVNDDDIYRSRRNSSRYHKSQVTTCNRCDQKGHSAKFCSFSKGFKCFICGDNHNSFRCKSKVCAKCFGIGHDIKYCPKRMDSCDLCQMPGHHQNICPDIWRRYQRTTSRKSKEIFRLFQDTPFFCYNCGLPGHFGALCKGRRMNTPAFPTWPFVLNYKVQNPNKVKPRVNASNVESFIANELQEQVPKGKKKKKKVKQNLLGVTNMQQISFPRTPKNSLIKPQNENSSTDKDSKLREKILKQEARKARRWRQKQRRKALLITRKAGESVN